MSPTKKKTKKTTTRKASKKPAAKKKAPKKKASKKKTAKKPAAKKKTAKKKVAKKAAAPDKTAKKTTKKTAKKATSSKAPAASAKKAAGGGKKKATRGGKSRSTGKVAKPIPLSGIPHPKYGFKFECFACGTRFYLMGKPEPMCPKCGADQRERPKESTSPAPKAKRPAIRPMAPLLDDDEEVATPDVETTPRREPREPDAMFDDAEVASVSEDAEEAPRRKSASDDED